MRGRADSPRPRKGCEPARPGGRRPAALPASHRRDPAGGGPRTLALTAEASPPPGAHTGRGQAEKASHPKTQFPTSRSYPKIFDEMRHDHPAAAAPGSASARRCVNTGTAPTAPPPFPTAAAAVATAVAAAAAAFFPETGPHPPGRMRHLAAAAAGRTLESHRLVAHALFILSPCFSNPPLYPARARPN